MPEEKTTVRVALGLAATMLCAASPAPSSGELVGVPTIAIPPGYKVSISGHPSLIFGFDECPDSGPHARATDCIMVGPNAKSVRVRISDLEGSRIEEWSVVRIERRPSFVGLQRQDGSLVMTEDPYRLGHGGSAQ